LDLPAIQFVIGVFLLLFGGRWLARAIGATGGIEGAARRGLGIP
jgi:uncharacterized membrane protein